MGNSTETTPVSRVVPRICATCTHCRQHLGRKFCENTGLALRNQDELTTTCADWQQAVLLTSSSISVDGKIPAWLEELQDKLASAEGKAAFYLDMYMQTIETNSKKRDGR